jgi:NADPH:quinone reductase
MKVGDTVLVLGASGGAGFAAMQLAKAFGASKVIGCVRGEANANFLTACAECPILCRRCRP